MQEAGSSSGLEVSFQVRCAELEIALMDIRDLIGSRAPRDECLLLVLRRTMEALHGDVGLADALKVGEPIDLTRRAA